MNWDFDVVSRNFDVLFYALLKTIIITFLSIILGTLGGIFLGAGSISSNKFLAFFCRIFIDVFLALPVLVVIIWLYYSLPLISKSLLISGENVAILSLALSLSAFIAEIIRAGINSIPKGQIETAYCLGFSKFQAIRYILIPQALQITLPAIIGQYITCYKMSTLSSVIGVNEILHTSNDIIAQTYRPIEIYTALAIIFLITVYPLNKLATYFEKTKILGGIDKNIMMKEILMKIKNITKSYNDKTIIRDFSFEIPNKSSVLIEGISGSGKTTLLRCIALLESIDSGKIFFQNKIISEAKYLNHSEEIRDNIGMVFQQLHLWGHLKVIENITLPLKLKGLSKKEANQRAKEVLEKLDISEKANDYPNSLSGGQQQRVAIARAIVHKPVLLLLDEITANLDEESAINVYSHLVKLNQEGTTLVIVSHNSRLIPQNLKNICITLN